MTRDSVSRSITFYGRPQARREAGRRDAGREVRRAMRAVRDRRDGFGSVELLGW